MRTIRLILGMLLVSSGGACASLPDPDSEPSRIATFANAAQIDAYIAAQEREKARIARRRDEEGHGDVIVVTGSRVQDVAITNVQEEGVDEGGIVKANSEYLVVLRRGRIHVVRHGDDTLAHVSSIDAFPPADTEPDDTWYDEMLLQQGVVIVIGYSYGDDGTEISRFDLSDDGVLTYRDTHYLNSWDYYSSSNYAARLMGGKLLTYTPSRFDGEWRESARFLERRLPDGSRQRIPSTLDPASIGLAAIQIDDIAPNARVLHGITQCDVLSEELNCATRAVLGGWSSEYYFSRDAAYLWVDSGHDNRWGSNDEDHDYVLYRVPLETSETMQAIPVTGAPVDQFSFLEDGETDSVFVMTVGDFVFRESDDFGLMMWEAEWADGDAALLRVPLEAFGNGSQAAPMQAYRPLPDVGGRVQNRFAGRYLLYGGGRYRDDDAAPQLFVTPLDQQWVQNVGIPHGVSRLDVLGSDAIAVGQDNAEALGISIIDLGSESMAPRLTSTLMYPATDESESRSQAFFYNASPGDESGDTGVMALPVYRALEDSELEFLHSSTSMLYLDRDGPTLSELGELGAIPDENVIAAAQDMQAKYDEDECLASCVDWYGNARPIFIGERIFALLGDELVEGLLNDGRIVELRRIDFTR